MTEFHLYRGLPASGKTTHARAWVAEDPAHRARINRDDLRSMLHAGVYLGGDTEQQIRASREVLISRLLRSGISVANDDTNLPQRDARALARSARAAGAEVIVHDFTDVSIEECIRRDVARERSVGDQVIRGMFDRYLAGKKLPLPPPEDEPADAGEPYVPPEGKPTAIMVDLDGTLCLHNGRSPFDETRVHEDLPNAAVVSIVRNAAQFHSIIYCSGRSQACFGPTSTWIGEHVGMYGPLFMRPEGDKRKDAIVKRELFDQYIRHNYRVLYVLDDRNQVVEMWRGLGLTVLQVADGDF